ncbi:hypothetical protein FRC12_004041 [Ceratobasidium sp. 428]|nr:hypothetical protein FRC12_004041 [Ceratobasidium sp. 428]
MFHGPAGAVYLSAFLLDIRYRDSEIFVRHSAKLHTEHWSSHQMPIGTNRLPDYDLRGSFPAYMLAGDYLVQLLAHIYNKDPDATLFSRYASWDEVEIAFRNQFILYTRGLSPFHQTPKPSTEHLDWESLRSVPSADILAHLGSVLASIVPNSMAEERSMSTLTKLNSPDRASQKVSTLIDMATIRQYYKREENQLLQILRPTFPTVRFTELPRIEKNSPAHEPVEPSDIEKQHTIDASEHIEDVLSLGKPTHGEDEAAPAPRGNGQYFEVEVTDGISLSSNMLIGMISDRSNANTGTSRPPELPPTVHLPPAKRQKVDFKRVEF